MSSIIDNIVFLSIVSLSIVYYPICFICVFLLLYFIQIVYIQKSYSNNKKYTCSICLEDINTKNNFSITQCKHHFHTQCLNTWLRKNDKCPICRFKLIDITDDIDEAYNIDEQHYINYIDPLDRMLDQDIN